MEPWPYKHVSRVEATCRCGCGTLNVDPKLLEEFDDVIARYFDDHEVRVSCVCRCFKHNQKVGGAKASYHLASRTLICKAIDFNVAGFTPMQVQKALNIDWLGGMEYAPTWTHLDLGPKRRFTP